MILTQKETMLLQDLKTQEQVCIEKYNQYAERANDPKLSQLLRTISSAEQQPLSTLEQMEKGTVPAMGGGQKQPFQPPASAQCDDVDVVRVFFRTDICAESFEHSFRVIAAGDGFVNGRRLFFTQSGQQQSGF